MQCICVLPRATPCVGSLQTQRCVRSFSISARNICAFHSVAGSRALVAFKRLTIQTQTHSSSVVRYGRTYVHKNENFVCIFGNVAVRPSCNNSAPICFPRPQPATATLPSTVHPNRSSRCRQRTNTSPRLSLVASCSASSGRDTASLTCPRAAHATSGIRRPACLVEPDAWCGGALGCRCLRFGRPRFVTAYFVIWHRKTDRLCAFLRPLSWPLPDWPCTPPTAPRSGAPHNRPPTGGDRCGSVGICEQCWL